MKQTIRITVILLSMACIYSCDRGRIYESAVRIPDSEWYIREHARFEVEITDTVSSCDVLINVRNNVAYKYMELWLFVSSCSPAGNVRRDTVKIMLADHHGKWLGKGLGDKFDNRLLFQKNVRFPVSGTYVFEYEHAMRDEPLTGIDDIGLRIEKHQP
jgi:gliding motility-associated lipoprotein GldH